MTGFAFWSLLFTFMLMISLRTKRNLRKLQDQHLANLPSRNALTFLDTEILCFIILFQFFINSFLYYMFFLGVLPRDSLVFLTNLTQMLITNITLGVVFPTYIILKTRRYLPKLWNDDCPLILQNNDFYSVRINQISPPTES